MEYKEFPDRELLRRIASNSLGRVSWQHLYDLCGYMELIKYALGKQLGFEPLVFDEVEVFKIVQNIRALQENIKVKKSNNLHGLLEEKLKELKEYCAKYNKDHNYMLKEYDRVYSFGYQAI